MLHDWGEEQVRELLAASFAALAPGGWLVDHDTHISETKTGPLPVAEYSVLPMHSTPGKCWSVSEIAGMLHDVGFADIGSRPAAADRPAIRARKPTGLSDRMVLDAYEPAGRLFLAGWEGADRLGLERLCAADVSWL